MSPPRVATVGALRPPLPICAEPVLAKVPPIVRLPPPSKVGVSTSSVPLLVEPLLTVSAAVPSSTNVPLLVNGPGRVNGVVSDSRKVPPLLVNPLPPLLNAKVAGWLDEPKTSKLAPLGLVSPPRVAVVATPRPVLPICVVPVFASVPPMVRLPPPSKVGVSTSSVPLLVKPLLTVSAAVPSSKTVPLFVTLPVKVAFAPGPERVHAPGC